MLASRPATRLDGLLQFILEKALAVTASDIGGGIFILETSGQELALMAAALRGEQRKFSPSAKILPSGET